MITASRTGASLYAAALILAGGTAAAWGEAIPQSYGAQFVETYAQSCLPERFSFEGSLVHAQKLGWSDTNLHLHDQLNALMLKARDALYAEQDDGFDVKARMAAFWRPLGNQTLYLVATEILTEYVDLAGCYIYDFGARQMIDPVHVTELLGHPIAYRTDGDDPFYQLDPADIVTVVWGPPDRYPRMFDTYLTFIPDGSRHAAELGFTGLMLKSETSLP